MLVFLQNMNGPSHLKPNNKDLPNKHQSRFRTFQIVVRLNVMSVDMLYLSCFVCPYVVHHALSVVMLYPSACSAYSVRLYALSVVLLHQSACFVHRHALSVSCNILLTKVTKLYCSSNKYYTYIVYLTNAPPYDECSM